MDYLRGFEDALELAIEVVEKHGERSVVLEKLRYALKLVKEKKLSRVGLELGALKDLV